MISEYLTHDKVQNLHGHTTQTVVFEGQNLSHVVRLEARVGASKYTWSFSSTSGSKGHRQFLLTHGMESSDAERSGNVSRTRVTIYPLRKHSPNKKSYGA
eukprot:6441608-Amphidinium_carterae.1